MNAGQTVFSQLIDHLPSYEFQKCVERYRGDAHHRGFSCRDQYLAMAFAQLTYRESLRDIEACLGSMRGKLYHMGFRGRVTRSTLGDTNEAHDWRIFADFAQVLIAIARPLYADDPLGVDLVQALYALDSTTIDLCLSVFPWARFRKHKGAVKMHTLLDLRGNIPTFIRITDGKVHDVNILDQLLLEAGGFLRDGPWICRFRTAVCVHALASAFFVVRTKRNVLLQRRYSQPVDKSTGVRSDQTVILATPGSACGVSGYPSPCQLLRCHYRQAVGVSDQQLYPARSDHRANLQEALGRGIIFSLDQAALTRQGILRNQRERGEDPDLDRGEHLRAGRHRAQTARNRGQPLPNPTDSQPNSVRETPILQALQTPTTTPT
jgi:hypothetical protein